MFCGELQNGLPSRFRYLVIRLLVRSSLGLKTTIALMSQPNSRAPSQAPPVTSDHQDGPPNGPSQTTRPQSRNRRRRSRAPRSPSFDSEEDARPPRRSNKKKGSLPAVDELGSTTNAVTNTVGGVVGKVGNTAGQATGGGEKEGSGSDKPLKLRLDVNLDVEITLEARVHGDLTLALL
jgi:hypothetical protein